MRRVGLSGEQGGIAPGRGLYQVYLYNLIILAVLLLGVLVTLATLVPTPFEKQADAFVTPPGTSPPWYLLASYGFMESFPSFVPRSARGLMIEAILAVSLLFPFLARSSDRSRGRRAAVAIGLAVMAAWLFFTWYGWWMETHR